MRPATALSEEEHAKNNLPDVLARWAGRNGAERDRARTEQSFCVRRRILPRKAMTSRSIATRRLSTKRWSTPPKRFWRN